MEKLIGKKIVGYRYGAAPACGYSWNSAEDRREPGVSMAQVGYLPEVRSFAIGGLKGASAKKYYYIGTIAGEGGDDEVCLVDVQRITYQEYLRMRKEYKDVSNAIVNEICDRKIRIVRNGWYIGMTEKEIEDMRVSLLK